MIGQDDVAFYRDNGYLVVPGVLSRAEVRALREVTDAFVERARSVASHDEIYDLEADPEELTNLAGKAEHAATLEKLRQALAAELKRTGAGFGDALPPVVAR